jgi:hypothetical protein
MKQVDVEKILLLLEKGELEIKCIGIFTNDFEKDLKNDFQRTAAFTRCNSKLLEKIKDAQNISIFEVDGLVTLSVNQHEFYILRTQKSNINI